MTDPWIKAPEYYVRWLASLLPLIRDPTMSIDESISARKSQVRKIADVIWNEGFARGIAWQMARGPSVITFPLSDDQLDRLAEKGNDVG